MTNIIQYYVTYIPDTHEACTGDTVHMMIETAKICFKINIIIIMTSNVDDHPE